MLSEYIYTLLQPIPHYITCPPRMYTLFYNPYLIISHALQECIHSFTTHTSLYHMPSKNVYTLLQPIPHYITCPPRMYTLFYNPYLIISHALQECIHSFTTYTSLYHMPSKNVYTLLQPIPHYITCPPNMYTLFYNPYVIISHALQECIHSFTTHTSLYHMPSEYIYTLLQPIPHYITCSPNIYTLFYNPYLIISHALQECIHSLTTHTSLYHMPSKNVYTLLQPIRHYITCPPRMYTLFYNPYLIISHALQECIHSFTTHTSLYHMPS